VIAGGGGARKRRRSSNRKPTAWQKSLAFKEVGRQAIIAHNRKRHRLPKCSATAKSTERRCGNLAMANGVCWLHGGLTPSGDQWGLPQFRKKPLSRQTPSDWRKVEAKLKQRAADDKDRARRLAAMTPDQRAAYDKRRRTHRPGGKAQRAAEREQRRQDDAFRETFARTASPVKPNPELQAIEQDIARLRAELERSQNDDPATDLGVFG
jgi:hypothetical protein